MTTTNNLPVDLTSFVGRRAEIERVSALLTSNRLVSLTGAGGVGKTRLATQAAVTAMDQFPDGIWFIDLSATSDEEVVPNLVADPLSVGDVDTTSARELTDVLAGFLTDKKLLLILDNCEHVIAAVRDLATTILTRCLDVKVLTTTRATIGIEGEMVFRVSPLPVVAGAGGRADAVQLFLDRASQVHADHDPDAESLQAVAEVVRRLDGLPLAIELAASRTKLFSPQQILERLTDRLQFLEGGSDRPGRHETLEATIEWSYGLLEPEEQQALQRLAVFNGWSLEGAEAALGAPTIIDLLGGLVDKSLIDVVPRSPANRYRMLNTVRRYVLERLVKADDEEAARVAHAEYFLDLAERSDAALRGPDQAHWVEQTKADHDNLRSALEFALTSGRVVVALRLVAAMGRFWFMQTHWKEALRWFDRVSDAAGDDHELEWARAYVKTGAIKMITRGGDTDLGPAERAHRILSEGGDKSELAAATYALSEATQGVGEAPELIAEAIRLFEEAEDAWGLAYAQRWVGSKVELLGDPEESITYQQRGVEGFRRLGDRWSAGWLSFDLGFSLLAMGRFEIAGAAFEDAIDLASGLDDRLIVAHAARGLASVYAGLGRPEEAESRFVDAIPLLEKIGDDSCVAFAHLYLADIASELGNNERGIDLLVTAIETFTRVDHRPGIAAAQRRLARIAAGEGKSDLAARLLGAAESTGLKVDDLSPPEQALLKEAKRLLEGMEQSEAMALRAEGSSMPAAELLAAVRVLVPKAEPATTAAMTEEDRDGPMWPTRYASLLDHIRVAWKVDGDILAHRTLGGKSGASVVAVDLACEDFSGQAILKLEEVDDPTDGETEAERHRLAFTKDPGFAADHLPRVVHSSGIAGSTAVLSTIAGRGLEYTLPWAHSPYPAQLEVGRRMCRAILEDWNVGYELVGSILTPQEMLSGWLDYRLTPPRGRIHRFVEEAGVGPEAPTVMWDGHWYPNPLAFAIGVAPAPAKLGLRPIAGNTHGDLHGYNVLVRDRDGDIDWFLIDLAFYAPETFLFFDHAYFELSHLLETRADASILRWMPLLAALAGRDQAVEDDVGLLDLLAYLRAQTSGWVEEAEPDRVSYMESQVLLARVAVGLNFTHKRVPEGLKQRGFLYAMSALKEYVKFHGVDWPRSGDRLDLVS